MSRANRRAPPRPPSRAPRPRSIATSPPWRTAKLNLSYCEIRSPLSGRTGNLLVHAGNLVKANDVPLVVIHQVAPIFVNFSVPEQHLAAVRRLNANRKLAVRVFAQDDPNRGATGALSVIDNTVDTATGTIHLKATFENQRRHTVAGPIRHVGAHARTIRGATVVPAEAVQAGQQGQFVYVVKPDNNVEIRPVTAGRAFGKKIGDRKRYRARRDRGHRRPIAPLPRRAGAAGGPGQSRRGEIMNLSRIFIERPVMTALISLRHPAVRRHRLPRAAGGRAAQRGLPHHPGERRAARRQPGNHGVHRGHPARARVLHHRRHHSR